MSKKLNYFGILTIILLSLILIKDLGNSDVYISTSKILTPFLYGFIIAYFINPIINYFQKKTSISRSVLLIATYIVLVFLLYLLFAVLLPLLAVNMSFLISDLPNSIDKLLDMIRIKFSENSSSTLISSIIDNIDVSLTHFSHNYDEYINLNKVIHYTKFAANMIMNLTIGLVVSIYMIKDKNKLLTLLKRIFYSYLEVDMAKSIVNFFSELNKVFSRFLIGKLIDSAIMGILFFIILTIFKVPYAFVMSVIFGITNIVPYFGPLLGVLISAVITLIYATEYAVLTTVIGFLLQQFDGFYLGPKILGGKVGLSPFWTMTVILIFGGLFGVMGMLLAVPTASVVKTILNRSIEFRLSKKNIELK